MREAISALQGAAFDGIVRVEDAGVTGMITLRGSFDSPGFVKGVSAASGLDIPDQRGSTEYPGRTMLWMSPDELLLICAYDEAPKLTQDLTDKLAGEHALVVNVSDARARITVNGALAHEVLGKLMPVDFAPAVFPKGSLRRTRMAQIPAAVWKADDSRFEVLMFRSVAQYAFDALSAAAQPGSEVGLSA